MKHKSVVALHSTLVVAIAGFVLLASAGAPPHAQSGVQIPQGLRARGQQAGRVRVLVELKTGTSQVPEARLANIAAVLAQRQAISDRVSRVLSRLSPGSHRTVRLFQTIPYIALEVTPAALDALETLDTDVARVMDDEILRPVLADSVPLIEADTAWSSGFDGTGTTIGLIDSGVDSTHPFLAGKVVSEACFSSTVPGTSESFCPNGQDQQVGPGSAAPCDLPDCIHGTHVAGIAAGNDPANIPSAGVAKGAHLMAVQVFSRIIDPNSCGGAPAPCPGAYSSDIISGLELVYQTALAGQQNIASVNLSLGGGTFNAACDTQPYKPIIDNLRAIGIPSVVAAGNDGSPFDLASPACISSAVSVSSTTKTDTVSYFSDVAPFLSLFAPGEAITSSVPGGGYEELSGSSMAAPHVSGAWAIIKQALPSASVTTVLNALRSTGLPITDTRYAFFFGPGSTIPRVRVFEALASLIPLSNPAPSLATMSPNETRAGFGAVALTVTGSGFIGSSVVQWNGNARPTSFVTSSKLLATILAADVAAVGTAAVRVATPGPGGGISGTSTFTIDPPPALTISAATVAPSDSETVTLANGLGGSTDFLALAATGAPDISYLQWTYVGAGVANRTWTVTMPSTAGTYEFRLIANGTIVATSPKVTVDASLKPVPVATSLSPSTVIAGGAQFTVTVTGSNFGSSSVVRWNGASRTTTFVSATQLQAVITAADIVSVGTGQVSVFTPAPGGGTSSSVPLAIVPAPTLAVSATNVAFGGSVTATLTGGLGGPNDWLSLAQVGSADTSYVQWTYVGAGVTTRTWAVTMPSTAGKYEFRLFLNNGYTRASTSPPVTVSYTTLLPPVLTVSSTNVTAGASVTMTLSGGFGGATDWLELAAVGASDSNYIQWTWVGTGVTSRTWTVTMPMTAGTYEFRFLPNNTYTHISTSPPVTVTVPVLPPVALTVNATNVIAGSSVTMTMTGGYGGANDWLALALVGSGTTSYVQWTWVGAGVTTRTWTVTMPASAGNYEFRYFPNNGYTLAGASPAVTVVPAPPPALTVSATSVARGASVTVTLTNGTGASLDWMSLAQVGSPNTSYLQWTWVGSGVTTRTWTVTMPTTPGDYEFRLFPNNGYVLSAVSAKVTVTP